MKTLRNSMIAILALIAVSCNTDDVEDRPVVKVGDAPVLTAPEEGNAYVLSGDNADVLAERFVWTAANFGEGIIPTYDLEIDFESDNFATPQIVGTTSGVTEIAVSNNVLNSALTHLNAAPDEPGTFQVRIKASVADMVVYSNAVEMLITPYQGVIPVQQLYIVGTATEFGYNNDATNTPLFRDPANQFKFYYTGYFAAGELKLLAKTGAWQPQYGSGGDGILAENPGAGTDPAAIVIATAGYYSFTVDLTAMTYTLDTYDAGATAPAYTSIGILGSATPTAWDSDTDLANTAGNTHIWHVSGFTVIDGETKFREGDAWTNSWGATTPISGQAHNANDPNIPTTAGTYNIWFNDLDGRYLFIPVN